MTVRIGVFICHCGHNIASTVDVEDVVEYAKGLPGVVYSGRNLYSCSQEGLTSIKESIKNNELDRVVVAACTPRTHEPVFRRACEQVGINKYLFEFVNIREHCSWIHTKEKEEATKKAKKLVAMGVAKVALLEPQEEGESDVVPKAAVIGAGLSGLSAAAALLNQGIETHIVEKEATVGGILRDIAVIGPDDVDAQELIRSLTETVEKSPKAHLHLSSKVTELKGFIGNFELTIYDLCGRAVETLHSGELAEGSHEFIWNGTCSGAPAPAGIYMVKYSTIDGTGRIHKIVLLD